MRRLSRCGSLAAWLLIVVQGMAAQTDSIGTKPIPDALSAIHGRKSVRRFTGQAVNRADLETMLRAGMAAPTAMNKQPWAFVAVTDRAQLDSLESALPHARMLKQAGAAVVVCAVPSLNGNRREFAVIDCSLASQNILLAAEALGLGAVWTAAYPDEERMGRIRKLLGVPEDIIPINVIPVGHPTGEDQPKDKHKPERIHWGRW